MVNDLFSSFDPQTKVLGTEIALNWIRTLTGLIFLPLNFWIKTNRFFQMFIKMLLFIKNEFKAIIRGKTYGGYLTFITIFTIILTSNFLGIFPYVFTATRHIVFTLTFSLTLWLSFILYGWLNFYNSIFSHLVPIGTPGPLIPFIVCIETIRNVIRSGTLAIRLSANIISGHLLLALLGGQGRKRSVLTCSILVGAQLILLTLEFSVSIIQAYVFRVLSTLYSRESTGHWTCKLNKLLNFYFKDDL